VFILAVIVVTAPMAAFFYQHPNYFYAKLNAEGIFQNGVLASEMAATGQSAAQVILGRIYVATAVFVARAAPNGFFNSPAPYLSLPAALFFGLGLVIAFARLREPKYALLLAWFWAVVIFGGALTSGVPASQRLVQSVPAVVIFIGLGLSETAAFLVRRRVLSRRVALLLCGAVVALTTLLDANFYFNQYRLGHYFEDASNELVLQVNEQALALGPDYRLYLLGEPLEMVSFPNFDYLTPDIAKQDYNDISAETLAALPRDKGAFFVALPERRADLELVAQLLPGGQWQEVRRRDFAEPSYFVYLLSPAQFDQRAGP
jgi:hypothetical protein